MDQLFHYALWPAFRQGGVGLTIMGDVLIAGEI
ncbi:hypothetical protein X747_12700 [Mesorhizobium sp. LNJC384A00]|nr:hypothetical protein X747_12700 [Mesorhizobium sp. LNJC384A00]